MLRQQAHLSADESSFEVIDPAPETEEPTTEQERTTPGVQDVTLVEGQTDLDDGDEELVRFV